MADFGGREMLAMLAMMGALLWLGLYPQPVLDLAQPVLDSLQALVHSDGQVATLTPAGLVTHGGGQ
jgi:NADH-quinone oxidoreductase subunit M